jgi:squalene-associated FAD-dependent desaturase
MDLRDRPSVLIVGGGLAGLAAASALAPRGFRVTILEARNRLGGRAGSFQDGATGQLVDTCQHVSMGCCTNLAHFFRTVGTADLLRPQPCLYFMTPDRRLSRLRADRFPAPFHLTRSFLSAHYLTGIDKARIAWALARLPAAPGHFDPPFLDWLLRHGQTPRTIDRFWGVVLTSALNETPDRIGLRYARKVFLDGFLRHRRGFELELPMVPLGELYGVALQRWFREHQIQVLLNTAVKTLGCQAGRVQKAVPRGSGFSPDRPRPAEARAEPSDLTADWYISAVPFDRLLAMLPAEVVAAHSYFSELSRLEFSPITSVHLWLDRPVTRLPHVVLVDCVGQWVFNRGEVKPGEWYVQVVVSASRGFRGLDHDEVQRRIVGELGDLFPSLTPRALRRVRVITEHAATFSAVPGVDRWRPAQRSPLPNLFVAGDWTATGWPATMESAVRSGYLAAEELLKHVGMPQRIVRPDLR